MYVFKALTGVFLPLNFTFFSELFKPQHGHLTPLLPASLALKLAGSRYANCGSKERNHLNSYFTGDCQAAKKLVIIFTFFFKN